jgi:hypothetical protein
MEGELTSLDTASVEAEWLCELFLDCDNQIVITKVNNSKDR